MWALLYHPTYVLAYWDLEHIFGILFKHFDKYYKHIFDVVLLMRVWCLKGLYNPIKLLIYLWLIKWCLLIWSLVVTYLEIYGNLQQRITDITCCKTSRILNNKLERDSKLKIKIHLISQRENYIMGYTIVSGNKPSSVVLHQNYLIVFIEILFKKCQIYSD